jgi:leader peptidase (prepilin peptidase)/N-methyltransferase
VATLCALGWFILFFGLNAVSPRLLGFGDVRLALVLGLALGWLGVRYVLLGFFAANLIGAVIGIALIATKRISRQEQIPYGVFLALGTALAIFAGPELLQPFNQFH